jgi:hypothetical protein
VGSEFDQLTAPLEVEFADDLDPRLAADVDAAVFDSGPVRRRP